MSLRASNARVGPSRRTRRVASCCGTSKGDPMTPGLRARHCENTHCGKDISPAPCCSIGPGACSVTVLLPLRIARGVDRVSEKSVDKAQHSLPSSCPHRRQGSDACSGRGAACLCCPLLSFQSTARGLPSARGGGTCAAGSESEGNSPSASIPCAFGARHGLRETAGARGTDDGRASGSTRRCPLGRTPRRTRL